MKSQKATYAMICILIIFAAGARALPAAAQVPAAGTAPTPVNAVNDAGSDTFPLDVAAAWTVDRKVLIIAIINPAESAQTLSLQIRGAYLAGKGLLRRIAPQSLTSTMVVGQEPGVKIEEQSVDQIPTNATFAPFSVNICQFPVK